MLGFGLGILGYLALFNTVANNIFTISLGASLDNRATKI